MSAQFDFRSDGSVGGDGAMVVSRDGEMVSGEGFDRLLIVLNNDPGVRSAIASALSAGEAHPVIDLAGEPVGGVVDATRGW